MIRLGATLGHRRAMATLACALLLTGTAAGCSPHSSTAARSRINVRMSDFSIEVSRHSVPAGTVDLHVTNDGPSTHEINVDLTRYAAAKIPLQADGLTAAEDARGLHRINSIEQVNLHRTDDLKVDLKPGRYVLWCNLEGHYLGGMHATFDVR
jgi:uncharacterized cupredoxin-like copper-binding protein